MARGQKPQPRNFYREEQRKEVDAVRESDTRNAQRWQETKSRVPLEKETKQMLNKMAEGME